MQSMTGFGRCAKTARGWMAEVEIGSVNRKQFDLRANLPRSLQALEPRLVALARRRIVRGQVNVSVRLAPVGMSGSVRPMDEQAVVARVGEIRRMAKRLKLADDLTASSLLSLREVMQGDNDVPELEQAWRLIEPAFAGALDRLLAMRAAEGKALQRHLAEGARALRDIAAKIKARAPRIVARYRQSLRRRLREGGIACAPMDPTLAREVALFADRADIAEELVRLESHGKQWARLIASDKPQGRTLDFLCQEMFREINTIGSKANDARVASLVIQAKAVLERMREQAQNVE